MALFYSPQKSAKKRPHFQPVLTADIIDLDYQGAGVAKIRGKTWFIDNALPSETVQFRVTEDKRRYGLGVTENILRASPLRQTPKCRFFGECGGCQSQHIPSDMQRNAKQQALFQRLQKLQKDIEFMPMMTGEPWQYRRRARLSLLFDGKTRQLEMGFRGKGSAQIVAVDRCEVLEPALNNLLPNLTALFARFSQPASLGHVELVAADNGVAVLLRVTQNLVESDRTLLLGFAESYGVNLFVQDNQSIRLLHGEPPYYEIQGLRLQFDIRDFIQVNADLNRKMVATASDWLALKPTDRVLDLFCGMGNFTLPISRLVKSAVGIEGVSAMVTKATKNAEQNHCENVEFYQTDLDSSFVDKPWANRPFDKILLDPPRSGAAFALSALIGLQPEKILYVSCNPATLIRDAENLLRAGYRLRRVAMIDMFPHTGHLESISLFEK
ncbi:23S rRNA (uracil(1939)-C(5))-methyltransferase [Actinobacillus succinogenes]|uniref:23S rRNA (uracil(1939)-C(5))-methyltransferase RlmD n=1 Tax=Actinobacillus succinogenes (strain ATCC 55618 / DSM 22257 / CCUG 43843 / 130Z) TaxID=339671 RepID=A6VKS5_ACTSZ|nr:23S rRNA (uracil(1939)-C(5))-methyltransferase RlmD [Actinobacillus succinogenes]ABR73572.1 RNA methyltransferase, TrmA family [Actinobacillus succinogenes 130Z]PHI39966.1 23S rRNA (uracil(1939)-C(5))-methyltransferase [Actinobacillus succinogenes]